MGDLRETDIELVRMFIEAVPADEASKMAGLWQGPLPVKALAAFERIIEHIRELQGES